MNPTTESLEQAAQKANELLCTLGIENQSPIKLWIAADYFGYKIQELIITEPNMVNVSGAVSYKLKTIFVNPSDVRQRQRFTVAHEIGHIVIDGEKNSYIDYRDPTKYDDPHEKIINEFAANLLMPTQLFIEAWKNNNKKVYPIAELFDVSTSAVRMRASQLRL